MSDFAPRAPAVSGAPSASRTAARSVVVERVLDRRPCPNLAAYVAGGGFGGVEAARAVAPAVVIETIADAGLRGRGGAGFPTGVKWRTVLEYSSPEGPPPVVVNAAEGEPGSFKDRALLRANPYRVIEGALIACHALAASELVIATKETFATEIERLRSAIAEVVAAGWADGIDVRVEFGPSHYLFGEETALLDVLGGGEPFPRVTPPYRRGVDFMNEPGRDETPDLATNDPAGGTPPVLVNNVETFANVPGILANGAEWYRQLGTAESPGTVVCTVVGSTERHGVAEVPMGTPLTLAIDEIGGGPRQGHRLVGAISGVANAYLPVAAFDTPLSYEAMDEIGSGLGSAGFIVFDDADDLRDVAGQISRFLAVESCGQCEPCKRDGLAISATFDDPDDAAAAGERRERLATVADSARCSLARQHRDVITSMLDVIDPAAGPADVPDSDAGAGGRERALVLPIVDIVEGRATFDERQLEKNPDWSVGGADSGAWPAAAATQVRVTR